MPDPFSFCRRIVFCGLLAGWLLTPTFRAGAALLAYEPFTNAAGTALIGSGDGAGFAGAWQANSSQGTATNTSYGLNYQDAAQRRLVTAGGAGFFQGLTTASSSMQPFRLFNFSRGTNGVDGTTTWISFLVARQGPTGTLAGNRYGRGANVDHDFNTGALQKLAIGNSSGAGSNTVALIPVGSGANTRGEPGSTFGGVTNFVVVRVDHVAGGNDVAYLFVNPALGAEPAAAAAGAVSADSFDFSFDRLRVFAGGQSSTDQPYAELVLDEYRLGETYADVAPYVTSAPAVLVITNVQWSAGNLILSGTGGTNGVTYQLLSNATLTPPLTNWPVLATNTFDAQGNFVLTSPVTAGSGAQFYRVAIPVPTVVAGPVIVSGPASLTVTQGQSAAFSVAATGPAPLEYQWYFNTTGLLAGETNASLTLTNVAGAAAGVYAVQVSNRGGSLMSTAAVLTVLQPPIITTSPVNQAVQLAGSATFTVATTGTAPLRYQWYFNTNTTMTGATSAALAITNAQLADAGVYSVIVANDYGAVTSGFAILTVNDPALTNGAFFVSPSGSDAAPGTISLPFLTISKGLTAIGTGGKLYLRSGTYALTSKLNLNKTASPTNRLRLWAYPGETPTIDATGNTSDGISLSGDWYHLKGLTVMHAGHNGINISGTSNLVELCTTCSNGNTGLHITGDTNTGYNLILNCDSYRNYDAATHGQNADGFSAKWIFGPGNVFSGCRAWENADDGWDLWMGTNTVVITNCWAFRQGTNVFGDTAWEGNGNGFKLGGNYVGTPHRVVRSAAFLNMANGIDQNNNLAGQTLDNNTGWANRSRNFALAHGTNGTPHVVRNNVSFAGGSSDQFTTGTLSTNNSWQLITSSAVSASDVQSVDYSGVAGPRQADGSLPELPFLRPVAGGRLVDRGVNLGEPFNGTAPDLGAWEAP